jgi:hypothetical protein
MKTNREKNTAYDRSQVLRVRPKEPKWNFTELDKVMRTWAQSNERSSL